MKKIQLRSASALALRLLPALALSALGSGCVGYNQVIFHTKSNAGIDFDSKPPATEVSISRKEGVIAPGFEGGKTPPVLASFQPHGGNGNAFENFFFGVDQTFAGGNAAIAMAELYDDPAPGSAADTAYESAIEVQEPTARFCWQKIPDASAARPFVFATDTLWGVKIGWTGQMPDSFKAGFNRKEIAWAPVSKERDAVGAGASARVRLRIPSFLATIDHDVKVEGTKAETGSVQYFATGRAATLLARQPAVRKAMLARLDPANDFAAESPVLGETLVMVRSVVNRRAALQDPEAIRHQRNLAALTGIAVPASAGSAYAFAPDKKTVTESPAGIVPSGATIDGLVSYNSFLADNADNLDAALQASDRGDTLALQPATGTPPPDAAAVRKLLIDARDRISADTARFTRQLSANQALVDAYRFALGSIQAK